MSNSPPQVPTPSAEALPAPARSRGRPPRKGRAFVKLSINIDEDLYTSIQGIAEHTSIPASRVINAILRAYHEADYAILDLGFSPGNHCYVTIKNAWPQRPLIPYATTPSAAEVIEDDEGVTNNDL
jgi:allophanate hydrolase subunit 1